MHINMPDNSLCTEIHITFYETETSQVHNYAELHKSTLNFGKTMNLNESMAKVSRKMSEKTFQNNLKSIPQIGTE